jgi:hypothetical protein
MLFNSFTFLFLFLFLPVTAIGYFLLARRSHVRAAGWLALASLTFYGWWSYYYIPLLLAPSSSTTGWGSASGRRPVARASGG